MIDQPHTGSSVLASGYMTELAAAKGDARTEEIIGSAALEDSDPPQTDIAEVDAPKPEHDNDQDTQRVSQVVEGGIDQLDSGGGEDAKRDSSEGSAALDMAPRDNEEGAVRSVQHNTVRAGGAVAINNTVDQVPSSAQPLEQGQGVSEQDEDGSADTYDSRLAVISTMIDHSPERTDAEPVGDEPELPLKHDKPEPEALSDQAEPVTSGQRRFDLSFLKEVGTDDTDAALLRTTEKRSGWHKNRSPIENYGAAKFTESFPGKELYDIIVGQIGKRPGNVGMDVLGGLDGVALQQLVSSGVLSKSIDVDLRTHHGNGVSNNPKLHYVAGDILSSETWQPMIEKQAKLAPQGLALIIHRPYGALQHQPQNVYEGGAHVLLDMLRPGGVLFTQVPSTYKNNDDVVRQTYRSLVSRGDIQRIVRADGYMNGKTPISNEKQAVLLFKK
jgi:hypothetical protein